MRHLAVVLFQLFLCDKGNRRIIIIKIIRHCLDGLFNLLKVCPFFRHYIAFPQMLVPCGKLRLASAPYAFHGVLNRHGILDGILYAFHAPDGVRMPLAYALSPECIGASLYQDGLCIQAV